MRRYFFVFFVIFFLTSTKITFAQSSYVLPYPSAMPGSISYKSHILSEELQKYWYFGNFGQFYYNLKQSDKYLVEAKTLFEYKQYLLGYNALLKSNEYFIKINPFLIKAKIEGKDISEKSKILDMASQKHVEILVQIEKNTPIEFVWTPEKSSATKLLLRKSIDDSISVRQKNI